MSKARTLDAYAADPLAHARSYTSVMDSPTPSSREESSYERERVAKRHLPRLSPEHYTGHAIIHWTLTTEKRASGWLTPEFHHQWQLLFLHTCSRYALCCPVHVLMPDHAHVILMGLKPDASNQRTAIEFLRKQTRAFLAPADWQHQSHDHVLKEHEKDHDAFQTIAHYVMKNPERAGLIQQNSSYPFLGCCVSGYPNLHPSQPDYWEKFWRIYHRLIIRV